MLNHDGTQLHFVQTAEQVGYIACSSSSRRRRRRRRRRVTAAANVLVYDMFLSIVLGMICCLLVLQR